MPLTLTSIFTMDPSQILYTIVLPFIIAFTIFWGVLSAMRIFGNKVNVVIAFVLASGLFFTDAYIFLGQFVFASGTFLATSLFILIFVFGIITWAFYRGRGIYREQSGDFGELKRINKEIKKVAEKVNRSTGADKTHYEAELTRLMQKRTVLEETIRQAHER